MQSSPNEEAAEPLSAGKTDPNKRVYEQATPSNTESLNPFSGFLKKDHAVNLSVRDEKLKDTSPVCKNDPTKRFSKHEVPKINDYSAWQSVEDDQQRQKTIAKIMHLLQQRKPNDPPEWWLRKLPHMAKRLEESLYRSAKSFEEYTDPSTLKRRLQQLAVNIGKKTSKMQQNQQAVKQRQLRQQRTAGLQLHSAAAATRQQASFAIGPSHGGTFGSTAIPQPLPPVTAGGFIAGATMGPLMLAPMMPNQQVPVARGSTFNPGALTSAAMISQAPAGPSASQSFAMPQALATMQAFSSQPSVTAYPQPKPSVFPWACATLQGVPVLSMPRHVAWPQPRSAMSHASIMVAHSQANSAKQAVMNQSLASVMGLATAPVMQNPKRHSVHRKPVFGSTSAASRSRQQASLPASFPISSARSTRVVQYTAPQTLAHPDPSLLFAAVDTCGRKSAEECPICLDPLDSSACVVSFQACNHEFHKNCALQVLGLWSVCPTCRTRLREPQGKMPSGKMTISFNSGLRCIGTQSLGTIIIQYQIPAGSQKSYHDSPGTLHGPAYCTAYLPDNDDGRKLLTRLEYAFSRGLTFTVGQPNSVTWSYIPHKTSLSGGTHGYPDPKYFDNCNAALDALGVPKA